MDTNNLINSVQGIWSTIQPVVDRIIPSTITLSMSGLFLRRKSDDWKKMQTEELGKIAKDMLNNGDISPIEYLKFKNIKQIALKADEFYSNNKNNSVNKENLGFDWFIRYIESASLISDEQMQDLWARLLAGEVIQPGSFSIRSIETLRNMSKKEAECLLEISKYIDEHKGSFFIYDDRSLMKKYDISKKMFILVDCGLIDSGLASFDGVYSRGDVIYTVGNLCCKANTKIPQEAHIRIYRFTQTGNDLLKLIEYAPDENYMLDCCRAMKKEYPILNITIHKIIGVGDNEDSFILSGEII